MGNLFIKIKSYLLEFYIVFVETCVSKPKLHAFPVTSLATFAANRLQIYLSQFYFICASFFSIQRRLDYSAAIQELFSFLWIGTKQF